MEAHRHTHPKGVQAAGAVTPTRAPSGGAWGVLGSEISEFKGVLRTELSAVLGITEFNFEAVQIGPGSRRVRSQQRSGKSSVKHKSRSRTRMWQALVIGDRSPEAAEVGRL